MSEEIKPSIPATPPPPALPSQSIPERPGVRDLFEALLRRPAELVRHPACDESSTVLRFAVIAVVSIFVFGFVLGTFAYGRQLWAAPLKMGGGLLFAGVICFPSFYIFSSLAGSRATASKMASVLCGMLALAGLLLLGFAPALWIFAQGTASFGFMGFLAVASWLVALLFSFRFLNTAMVATGASQKVPLLVWSLIFLLVTLQLSTSLRPILGTSDKLLTTEKKFFLEHWAETMGKSVGEKEEAGEASDVGKEPVQEGQAPQR